MFTNLFPPVVSGSSTQSYRLAIELTQRGHEVVVITAHLDKNMPEYEEIEGVHVYRIPAFRLPKMGISLNFPWISWTFTPSNQKRIAEIIQRHQSDILHSHNHMFDLAFSAVRMSKRFKLPLVTTIHTMIKHSTPIYNVLLYPADRIFLKYAVINNSNILLCPDENMKDYTIQAWGRHDEPIVPYGIAIPPATDGLVAALKEKYQLEGKRVILSLGHVHDIRNRKNLVAAMPKILESFPNTVLLIVGAVSTNIPGDAAKRFGVEESVIFAGPVPHDHVSSLLELADLEAHFFYQDDPFKTSLGIASLEVMSAGRTLLALANPDTYGKGLLKDGENFVMVYPLNPTNLAELIIDVLQDDEKRKTIGENARKTIEEHFSWESVCSKTLAIYEQAIEQHQAQ